MQKWKTFVTMGVWGLTLSGCSGQSPAPQENASGQAGSATERGGGPIAEPVKRSTAATLPTHQVDSSSLAPKAGLRVQINVTSQINKSECQALIERYRDAGAPDGQISVHKPSAKLKGAIVPWCVENFDGKGISFNDDLF